MTPEERDRIARLLRLGSEPAAGAPSPGFEARLRLRLTERAAQEADHAAPDVLAALARPALAAAMLVTALSCAAFFATRAGIVPGAAPELSVLASPDRDAEALLEDWGAKP